jgi:hypothetical protein
MKKVMFATEMGVLGSLMNTNAEVVHVILTHHVLEEDPELVGRIKKIIEEHYDRT